VAWDALPIDLSSPYRDALATLGAQVAVHVAGGDAAIVRGRALDVEADGRLVVLDDCGVTHRFATGDVVHLR
jgi:BirA family biotin operon repressor/biotin-[acetyl-CoA-carboxylase] ligase